MNLRVVLFFIPQVLVKVPGVDIAEEMVKVNNFMPMKMGNKDLLMKQIKQPVSLSSPVQVNIVFTAKVFTTVEKLSQVNYILKPHHAL